MAAERLTLRLPPSDTDPVVERLIVDGYRRMTPSEKMRRIGDAWRAAVHFAEAGLRARSGDSLSERDLRRMRVELMLDPMTARAALDADVKRHS
jgi:hypothetical protein